MAKRTEKRLRTRGFRMFLRIDEGGAYIPLAQGSDFKETGDIGTADGSGYEQAGHRFPVETDRGGEVTFGVKQNRGVPRIDLRKGDIVDLFWLDEDDYGLADVEILITRLERGRPHNGLPTWALTAAMRSDGTEVTPANVDDFLPAAPAP